MLCAMASASGRESDRPSDGAGGGGIDELIGGGSAQAAVSTASHPGALQLPRGNDRRPRPLGPQITETGSDVSAPGSAPERPANSPVNANASLSAGAAMRTIGALGIVLTLIVALAWGLRKLSKQNAGIASALGVARAPSGILSVLGRYPLSRGQTLVLIQFERRVLLLSQSAGSGRIRGSAGSVTTLCEITDPEEVASILLRVRDAEGDSASERFRTMLDRFDRTHDAPGVIEVPRGREGIVRDHVADESGDDFSGAIKLTDFERLHAHKSGGVGARASGRSMRGGRA
jgi:flagellar biogenesis protein FliO